LGGVVTEETELAPLVVVVAHVEEHVCCIRATDVLDVLPGADADDPLFIVIHHELAVLLQLHLELVFVGGDAHEHKVLVVENVEQLDIGEFCPRALAHLKQGDASVFNFHSLLVRMVPEPKNDAC